MKKTALMLLMGALAVFGASAGDLAVLENLGFSPDGRYFMFAQHVLLTDSGQAYAELAVVDVAKNEFVPGGFRKGSWDVGMWPGQSSKGAMLELLEQASDVKERYGISHVESGRLLYTRVDGDEESGVLSFRDFEEGGRTYGLTVNQEAGEDDSAAFYIDMTVTDPSGLSKTYQVGRPGYFRSGVASYRIDRVWLGPNGRSLVIAVAKIGTDLSARYMVETLVLAR